VLAISPRSDGLHAARASSSARVWDIRYIACAPRRKKTLIAFLAVFVGFFLSPRVFFVPSVDLCL
jgi:hypothetical protein